MYNRRVQAFWLSVGVWFLALLGLVFVCHIYHEPLNIKLFFGMIYTAVHLVAIHKEIRDWWVYRD